MNELLSGAAIYTFVCVVAAALAGVALHRWRPSWSLRRLSFVAALPVPALVSLLCTAFFARVVTTPREYCGVDVCGMAMGGTMMLATVTLWAFVISWAMAALLVTRLRR